MKRLKTTRASLLALAVAASLGLPVTAASASFGLRPDPANPSLPDFHTEATDEAGDVETQAAGHPLEASVRFALNTIEEGGGVFADESARDVDVELPPGFLGNPQAAATCSTDELRRSVLSGTSTRITDCPVDSQVGTVKLRLTDGPTPRTYLAPVYDMVPFRNEIAAFGFSVLNVPVRIIPRLRPNDHGITVESPTINQTVPFSAVDVRLWGVPADPVHDPQRGLLEIQYEDGSAPIKFGGGLTSTLAPVSFLTLPSDCRHGPFATSLRARSWQHPDRWVGPYETTTPSGATGCNRLSFEPAMDVRPSARHTATPTGLQVDLRFPQSNSTTAPSTPPLRRATVTLPDGMTINPPSADGLVACSDAQLDLESDAPPSCPLASQIGVVLARTPLLAEPLEGHVYIGAQLSDDPESGRMYRLFMVLEGRGGLVVKLAGEIKVNPRSGRVETIFDENPQVPVSEIQLQLKAGPRAPLVTPGRCGTYPVEAVLSSWGGQVANLADSLTIDEGCDGGSRFSPGFVAGVSDPGAGRFSPFSLRVTRQDGEQNVSRIEATLPEGELAKLAGVPVCDDAQVQAGSCPAGSQVGMATVGVGAGSDPLYVPPPGGAPTAAYLAGPYRGAPYSLVVKVPAQAGPFDLGTVTVRNGLYVDPESTRVTAKSDPLPQILAGVPVSYRDIRVDVDRPRFTLNPTSCEPLAASGSIGGAAGGSATVSSPFQVVDCAALGFKPRLSLSLAGATRRGGFPKLHAVVRAGRNQANLRRVSVALPHSEFLAQEHIRTICTRVQFAAGGCPAGSVYGRAKATTPLLDEPLEGPVYLRSSSNPLPDLVVALHGQVDLVLVGRIDSIHGGIRSTFEMVPDAPLTRFDLTMKGGRRGLLVNSRNLCGSVNRSKVRIAGQNGRSVAAEPVLENPCRDR